MGLFDFIKTKKSEPKSPEKIIKRLVDYMPNYYSKHQHFIDCIDFLNHKEWELALDSLIELADETGHYFSEEFWTELINASESMGLKKYQKYCHNQIKRNAIEIKSKTPFGWTTNKIDDTHFEHHISQKIKGKWANDRRAEDHVNELINFNGIHYKPRGRNGFLYYVKNEKIAEVEYELGINGLIIWFDQVNNWELPVHQNLNENEKEELKNEIIKWSNATGNAIEFN